jgi:hypothetical protein
VAPQYSPGVFSQCRDESDVSNPLLNSDAGFPRKLPFPGGLEILIGEVVLARGFINDRSNDIGVERQVCFVAIYNRV